MDVFEALILRYYVKAFLKQVVLCFNSDILDQWSLSQHEFTVGEPVNLYTACSAVLAPGSSADGPLDPSVYWYTEWFLG